MTASRRVTGENIFVKQPDSAGGGRNRSWAGHSELFMSEVPDIYR